MRRAVYPGTFDPLTNGHLDIISRACSLFDEVVVAVLVNPGKKPLFPVKERIALIEEIVRPLHPAVRVEHFSGLLIDFARDQEASAIIRGVRSARDYEYELPMALMNRRLSPNVETVLLIASPETSFISSSLIKEVDSLGGSIVGMVPDLVISKMKEIKMSTTPLDNTTFPLSARAQKTSLSSTAAVVMAADKLRAQGVKVIDLGVGEPDFPTPEHIKLAAKEALDQNFTKYTAASGIMPLRQAICDYHNQNFGSDYTPDQCCVVLGGKQGIFNAVLALINPGDEVLLENPSWVSFPEIVHFAEGKNVLIDTESTDFHLTADLVRAAITPKSKLLIINSPSNPTGRVIDPVEFEKIVRLAVENNIWVISDECYLQLVYPPNQVNSAASLPPELRSRVLIAGSLSKTYAMTGWRVGFTLGPKEWVTEVIKIQSQSATHAASIAQKAAISALTGSQQSVADMLVEYKRRGEWLVPALNEIPGIQCSMPEGAFYAFPNVKGLMKDCGFATSKELADELLHKYGIVLTAGSAFGAEGYLRISYANSLEAIQEAVSRIRQLISDRSR